MRDNLHFSGKLVRLMLWSDSGELVRLMQTKEIPVAFTRHDCNLRKLCSAKISGPPVSRFS
jgi:hypothetical protein